MKLHTLFFTAAALFSLNLSAAEYRIDEAHANARFYIDHFATSTNHAGFYGLGGTVMFDPAQKTGAVDISIPVDSINSGHKGFDGHLKSADIFNAAQYPVIRFVSDKWHFDGDKVAKIDGQLTLLGKTRPVSLTARKFNCYDSPMLKTQVCGGDFETTIDRTQWGVDYLVAAGMSKNVKIVIQIEAARK